MQPETIARMQKFEKDHDIRLETHEYHEHPVYWEVTVWMTKPADYMQITGKMDVPRIWGRKYVSTPTAGGQVLVIRSPQKNDAFSTEWWGDVSSYDSFVDKVMARVEEDPLDEDFSALCQECGVVIPAG